MQNWNNNTPARAEYRIAGILKFPSAGFNVLLTCPNPYTKKRGAMSTVRTRKATKTELAIVYVTKKRIMNLN